MQNPSCYPTDLTEEQWTIIQPMIPQRKKLGRPPRDRRAIFNAILYAARSGGAWRLLPKNFPPWQTVYGCFWRWNQQGILSVMHDVLRSMVRIQQGRASDPSAGKVSVQSISYFSRAQSWALASLRPDNFLQGFPARPVDPRHRGPSTPTGSRDSSHGKTHPKTQFLGLWPCCTTYANSFSLSI